MEDNGWQSDAPSEGMLTEEEDQYPIGQPKAGWEEAERTVHGYSKTKEYQKKKSYHKHKEEIKRRRDEKKTLSAGIEAKDLSDWGLACSSPVSKRSP